MKILDSNVEIPRIDDLKKFHNVRYSAIMLKPCLEGTYIENSFKIHLLESPFFPLIKNDFVTIDEQDIPYLVTYVITEHHTMIATLYFIYFDPKSKSRVILKGLIPTLRKNGKENIDHTQWPSSVDLLVTVSDQIEFLDKDRATFGLNVVKQ